MILPSMKHNLSLKRRKSYKVKNGHRQQISKIEVTKISMTKSSPKAKAEKVEDAKVEESK